jgi:hypothetical protein
MVAATSPTNSVAFPQAAAVPPYLSSPRNASFAASGFVARRAWAPVPQFYGAQPQAGHISPNF